MTIPARNLKNRSYPCNVKPGRNGYLLQASGELSGWRRRGAAIVIAACTSPNLAAIRRRRPTVAGEPAPATAAAVRACIRAQCPDAAAPAGAGVWTPLRLLPAAAALAALLAGGWMLMGIRSAPPGTPAALRAARPAAMEGDPALDMLLTDSVVEIRRAADLNGSATPLEMEMMLLEGWLI